MEALAVVIEQPEKVDLRTLSVTPPASADVVVDVTYSGISTGTERLFWAGRMPPFPGMGYPLVPGYESVGTVRTAARGSGFTPGDHVFVPGANCFGEIRGLFGGAASTLVTSGKRIRGIDAGMGPEATLLALAASAKHALDACDAEPELIVGHGVLGRLLARIATCKGMSPTVWERNPTRSCGARGYTVLHPDRDRRDDYHSIIDVSGDASLLDALIGRLAPGGEIVLAGFYPERVGFAFPPAFMREARLRISAEWTPRDLDAVLRLIDDGRLSLDGLVTHTGPAADAADAYAVAFDDPSCLKMVLDWRAQ